MKTKLKQFLCGIARHKFRSTDVDCQYNVEDDTFTVTQTCCRCGKQFSFTAPSENFGLLNKGGK